MVVAPIITTAASTGMRAAPSLVRSRLSGGRIARSEADGGVACTLPASTLLSLETILVAILLSWATLGNASFRSQPITATTRPTRTRVTVWYGAAPAPWLP